MKEDELRLDTGKVPGQPPEELFNVFLRNLR